MYFNLLVDFQVCDGIDLSMCYISILCTMISAEFKSDTPVSEMSMPFLRSLKTTRFTGTPLCPYLEQPNVVTGLPAQCKSATCSFDLPSEKEKHEI